MSYTQTLTQVLYTHLSIQIFNIQKSNHNLKFKLSSNTSIIDKNRKAQYCVAFCCCLHCSFSPLLFYFSLSPSLSIFLCLCIFLYHIFFHAQTFTNKLHILVSKCALNGWNSFIFETYLNIIPLTQILNIIFHPPIVFSEINETRQYYFECYEYTIIILLFYILKLLIKTSLW